jgi:hypothetical protein
MCDAHTSTPVGQHMETTDANDNDEQHTACTHRQSLVTGKKVRLRVVCLSFCTESITCQRHSPHRRRCA